VIGVGVKNSTSDLLIANCDEFIFYDDLVREKKKPAPAKKAAGRTAPSPEPQAAAKKPGEDKQHEAIDLVVETIEALMAERGGDEKIWASMVKQALKRRKPGFNESYYGFKSFKSLLEAAQKRGLLQLVRDEKSGYLTRLVPQED
jgi:hypothetical protein